MATRIFSIDYPININIIDDVEMHEWYFEFIFDDGNYDHYTNYGTAREALEWILSYMKQRDYILYTSIRMDCMWWGEIVR